MKLLDYIERINLIHKLIKEKRTGTPKTLAQRLRISPSRLYVLLDELKLKGAPIDYSRSLHSYFYTTPFEISIRVDFTPLNNYDLENTRAGFYEKRNSLLFL